MLRRFDANGDGLLEGAEVPGQQQPMVAAMIRRAGLDASRPVALADLERALSQQGGGRGRGRGDDEQGEGGRRGNRFRGEGGSERPNPDRPAPERPASAQPPASPSSSNAVRGFGGGPSAGRAAGFGTPGAAAAPSAAATANAAAGAESMLTRYDRNRDGKLDTEEMARYRWGNLSEADRSGDGNVTKDELTAWLAARAQGAASASAAPAGSTAASPASTARPAAAASPAEAPSSAATVSQPLPSSSAVAEPRRRSYRFLSALERLPPGLPGWFREKDGDKDGQVMMSEWTTQWSDAAVAEFDRYDRNGDGVITPAEALRSGG